MVLLFGRDCLCELGVYWFVGCGSEDICWLFLVMFLWLIISIAERFVGLGSMLFVGLRFKWRVALMFLLLVRISCFLCFVD